MSAMAMLKQEFKVEDVEFVEGKEPGENLPAQLQNYLETRAVEGWRPFQIEALQHGMTPIFSAGGLPEGEVRVSLYRFWLSRAISVRTVQVPGVGVRLGS